MADFFDNIEVEAERVKQALGQLKVTSVRRYHITHGAETMALSMGIKRISNTSADRLYLWAFKRYAKEYRRREGKQWPMEPLIRTQLFHYGRDRVLEQLKGLSNIAKKSKKGVRADV